MDRDRARFESAVEATAFEIRERIERWRKDREERGPTR